MDKRGHETGEKRCLQWPDLGGSAGGPGSSGSFIGRTIFRGWLMDANDSTSPVYAFLSVLTGLLTPFFSTPVVFNHIKPNRLCSNKYSVAFHHVTCSSKPKFTI